MIYADKDRNRSMPEGGTEHYQKISQRALEAFYLRGQAL